jgi:hypothetical protein
MKPETLLWQWVGIALYCIHRLKEVRSAKTSARAPATDSICVTEIYASDIRALKHLVPPTHQ